MVDQDVHVITQTICVSVGAQKPLAYAGMVELELEQQHLDACVLKVAAVVQHFVIQAAQFSVVLEQVTFVIHNTAATDAELSATLVQEQVAVVQNPGVVILTNAADLVALHSLLVILIVHVQHTITWQFLRDYLPVTAA